MTSRTTFEEMDQGTGLPEDASGRSTWLTTYFWVCTVLTLDTSVGKNRDFHYQGITIEFSRISPALFFGFSHIDNFHMASPEKAVLDTLYYRGMIPAQDELEMDELDFKSFLKMVDRYHSSVSRAFSRLSNYYRGMIPAQDELEK